MNLTLMVIIVIFLTVYNNTFYINEGINKNKFKEIKRENKNIKINKITRIIFIILTSILAIFIGVAILLGLLLLGMFFITLGGAAYVDAGGDSSFYLNLAATTKFFFKSSLIIFVIWIYFLIIKIFIKQITLWQRLKEKEQLTKHITNNDKVTTRKRIVVAFILTVIILVSIIAILIHLGIVTITFENIKFFFTILLNSAINI